MEIENPPTTDATLQDVSRKRKAEDTDVNDSEDNSSENALNDDLQTKNGEDTPDGKDVSEAQDPASISEPTNGTAETTEKEALERVNDTASETGSSSNKNPYESMRWIVVRNDGTPESMIKLVGLKSLFAKQLPKMPRAYIARLVFDRRHTSVAILSDNPAVKDSDEEIIGGICYRAFPDMRFGEIAFCAVNATHQVKGYGTKLMNLLKKTGAETGVEYFITYADNYAIGYFKKQGFSKSIAMPKGRYFGLIKDCTCG
jgi:ribosomal protein S18 acetylase RimI-like enzyme